MSPKSQSYYFIFVIRIKEEFMRSLLLNNWNVMRIIKTLAGIYIAYEAIAREEVMIAVLAAILLYQGLFNVSACGIGGCNVSNRNNR